MNKLVFCVFTLCISLFPKKSLAIHDFAAVIIDGFPVERILAVDEQRAAYLDQAFPKLLKKHGVISAGVGVIKQGELSWAGYYGEHSPGVSTTQFTQFDVASITKVVTTETLLRLVEKGEIMLDEPMAKHWMENDIAMDPRSKLINARMALTHSSGLPNWRFLRVSDGAFDPSEPLKIHFDPGTRYMYSGEGIEYAARFTEKKLTKGFEQLVMDNLFVPLGMQNVSFAVNKENFSNIVQPRDKKGVFHGHYCRPSGWCRSEGEWSAADDLRVSVPDFAKFLIASMNGKGLSKALVKKRNTVHVEKWNVPASVLVLCEYLPKVQCPKKQGYGLGWEVADYGSYKILSHGGSDWSEAARTYFYTDTKDGAIIFLNAPNEYAEKMMPEALALLEPNSPIIPHYQQW